MRWTEDRPRRSQTLYDRVLEIGDVVTKARGLKLAEEWADRVSNHILKTDPEVDPEDIGFTEVLAAMRELGYLEQGEKQ